MLSPAVVHLSVLYQAAYARLQTKMEKDSTPKTIISGVEVSLGIPLFASQSSMDTR